MPLTAGTRLGPYEIESALGRGGMGEVYKANDTRLDRTVAVKVMPPQLAADAMFRERFEREARSISSLNHPNICTLHDVGREGDIDYLVLEYLEGETLYDRLKKGPLPLAAALKIAMEIASALEKAHSQKIVHRDLKPGNIILTSTGAKLLDFGLAKVGNAPPQSPAISAAASMSTIITPVTKGSSPLTVHGAVLGTYQYMSPEQISGEQAGPRSDLWALGCVIFEMITGRMAFEGKTQAALIATIATADPDTISPPALDHAMRRCLAKDPEERWQTAHDLLIRLRWIAGGHADVAAPVTAVAQRSVLYRNWLLLAMVAMSAVLAWPAFLYFRGAVDAEVFQFQIRMRGLSPQDIAISPDGRIAAMVVRPETSAPPALYTRRLNAMTFQKLGGTEEASQPFFSHDGRNIGFIAKGKLKRVSVAGGAPQDIAPVQSFSGGSWSSSGVIVYGSSKGVHRVSAEGGAPVEVTTPEKPETGHLWPKFLPDGRHFLYLAWSSQPAARAVFVGDLTSKNKTKLLAAESNASYAAPGYLLFHRASSLFAQPFDAKALALKGEPVHVAGEVSSGSLGQGHYDVSQAGVLLYNKGSETATGRANTLTTVLDWLNRSGSRESTIGEQGSYGESDVSPDGKFVAVTQQPAGSSGADIWVIEWERSGVASRLTLDPADDMGPVWAPDGKRIAFTSYRKGNADIYVKNANGLGPETPLLESPVDEIVRDISKDGRYLAYLSGEDDSRDIFVLPLEDGKPAKDAKPIPVIQGPFQKDQPQFSYDGRWLAYTSNESGAFQVYVISFPAMDQKIQVSVNGGGQPRWRKDGKELYFCGSGARIMVAEIKAGARIEATPPTQLFAWWPAPWGSDPVRHLMSVSPDGQRFLRYAPSRAGLGASGSGTPTIRTFAGANVLVAAGVAANSSTLTVMQNWTRSLTAARTAP